MTKLSDTFRSLFFENGDYSIGDAYILCIPFGWLGLHHFYLGRRFFGIVYLLTFGALGFGWIVDIIRLPWLVRAVNQDESVKRLDDAYILVIPLGWLGIHQLYLGRKKWCVFYAFTLGVLGVGWLIDIIRMQRLVSNYNPRRNP
ncbi:TM2 domain-containing protein DDB_G0278163-like [Saccoglossus kowalevskii]|uniref:Uncharacterized protein LOC100368068 n=1 Tax=Saccoglossus kowalevskii TaxID=10224 RepID=A0ABM0M5I4_SACKO|nr:PREDICTED: uncharacterized protein LOC100368068 [Saccoglossus kowalevskii]